MRYLRKRKRSTRLLLGVAAVATLAVARLMVGVAAAVSSNAPTVEIQGNTYNTQSASRAARSPNKPSSA